MRFLDRYGTKAQAARVKVSSQGCKWARAGTF